MNVSVEIRLLIKKILTVKFILIINYKLLLIYLKSLTTMSHGKGDAASQWEMAILGCQNSVTPEPVD